MRRLLVLTLLACGLAFEASAAENAPYVGVWDCGVGQFTFTNETYNPGDGPLFASEILDNGDGNYVLTFEDGYEIGLSVTTSTTLTWSSGETGDQFECTRLYR